MSAPAPDYPRALIPPPLVFSVLLLVGLAAGGSKDLVLRVQIFGVAIALIGLVLMALALGLFRSSKTRPEPWHPSSTLVMTGIYRVTRNPMYLGITLLSLGIAIFFVSLPAVATSVLAMLIIDRRVITREEAYLVRRFGEHYTAYHQQVRR